MTKKFLLLFAIALCSCTAFAQLDTLSLEPQKDTYIKAILAGSSTYTGQSAQNGSESTLAIQKIPVPSTSPAQYYVKRDLLQFDIAQIPQGAIVTSAKLYMHKTSNDNSTRNIKARLVTESWTESTATWSNMATKTNSATAVDQSYNHGDTMIFNLTSMVQNWTCLYMNYGVMISPTADNQSGSAFNMPFDFYSREASSAKRPRLVVQYYLPINAVGTVTEAATLSSTDGAISLRVGGGDGSGYTYQWYDSGFNSLVTTKDISGKVAGLYAVKITDSHGGVFRRMFIIPCKSTNLTVTVRPNSEFGKDGYYTATTTATSIGLMRMGTLPNAGLANGVNSPGNKSEGVHQLDVDFTSLKDYSVTNARVDYKQSGAIDTLFAMKVFRITETWTEDCVCNAKRPAVAATNFASIAYRTSDYPGQNWSLDLTSEFDAFAGSSSTNQGFLFTPDSVKPNMIVGHGLSLSNYTSEYTNSTLRPLFSITIHPEFKVTPTVDNVSSHTTGYVKLIPRSGTGPYKYYWGDTYVSDAVYDSLVDYVATEEFPFNVPTYAQLFRSTIDSVNVRDATDVGFSVIDDMGIVYSGKITISDSLEVDHSTGSSISSNVITRTAADASQMVLTFMNGIESDGTSEIEFTCDRKGGKLIYGFRLLGAPDSAAHGHIKYGVEFYNNRIRFIQNGTLGSIISKAFDESVLVKITTLNGIMEVFLNGISIGYQNLPPNKVLAEDIYLSKLDGNLHIHSHKMPHLVKTSKPKIKVYDLSCDASRMGSVFVFVKTIIVSGHYLHNSGAVSYRPSFHLYNSLIDETNLTGEFNNLPPGPYTLQVSSGNPQVSSIFTFEIGYEVEWTYSELLEALNCYEGGDGIIASSEEVGLGMPMFMSRNQLAPGTQGWIEFNTYCSSNSVYTWRNTVVGFRNMYYQDLDYDSEAYYQSAFNFFNWPLIPACAATIVNGVSEQVVFNSPQLSNTNYRRIRISRSTDTYDFKIMNPFFEDQTYLAIGTSLMSPFSLSGDITESSDPLCIYARLNVNNPKSFIKVRASFGCPISPYGVVRSHPDQDFHLSNDGILRFQYVEEYSDQDNELQYKIYPATDSGDDPLITNATQVVDIALGYNYESIDINALSLGYYILEVTNEKKEKFYLRFKKI